MRKNKTLSSTVSRNSTKITRFATERIKKQSTNNYNWTINNLLDIKMLQKKKKKKFKVVLYKQK